VALVSVLKLNWVPLYSWMLLISIVLFSFLSESSHSKSWRDISLRAEVIGVGSSWLTIILVLVLVDVIFHPSDLYNREMVFYWFVLTPIELISWHSILRMVLRLFRHTGVRAQTVAIYGATELGAGLEGRVDKKLHMEITNDGDGGSVEMQLGGSATAVNGVVLESGCRRILEQLQAIPRVSINCADLDYIDSSALGTLMLLKANILRRGGALGLFRVSGRIRRLMRLQGVEAFLLE
jgi:anti-anti-sigma factor